MIKTASIFIGGDVQAVIKRTKTQIPKKMQINKTGVVGICGLITDIAVITKRANRVKDFSADRSLILFYPKKIV